MSDVVIRAERLGKKYLIGRQVERERYTALRDVLVRSTKNLTRSAIDIVCSRPLISGDEVDQFWALKDVSFEIKRGEVVGIIGRNGAGKSTLLKILSRITEPSAGRVEIKGRVASLLEVGTGFHSELTGRENIYLNGAILGMSRAEIKRKFDEIVAFAEIEKFLETPVKRYSSGMYVRLAFAVAAHLEPEILIVDEVLAVGDAEFQKKSLGKMGEVAGSGRTVLFVSHNIGSVNAICDVGLLLESGSVRIQSNIQSVTHLYRTSERGRGYLSKTESFSGPLKLVRFDEILFQNKQLPNYVTAWPEDELSFEIRGHALANIADFRFAFALYLQGQRIVTMHEGPERLEEGPFRVTISIPAFLLRPGEYSIALGGRRVVGDEWTWATDLATVELMPKWGQFFDPDDLGLINLPGRISRGKLIRAESYDETAATPANHNDLAGFVPNDE